MSLWLGLRGRAFLLPTKLHEKTKQAKWVTWGGVGESRVSTHLLLTDWNFFTAKHTKGTKDAGEVDGGPSERIHVFMRK